VCVTRRMSVSVLRGSNCRCVGQNVSYCQVGMKGDGSDDDCCAPGNGVFYRVERDDHLYGVRVCGHDARLLEATSHFDGAMSRDERAVFVGVSSDAIGSGGGDRVRGNLGALGRHAVAVRGLVRVLVSRGDLDGVCVGDFLRIDDFSTGHGVSHMPGTFRAVGVEKYDNQAELLNNGTGGLIGRVYELPCDGTDECTVLLM
jgi:hypothetical protein